MSQKQLSVFWSGRVQGVGFRATAEAAALECGLTGWVRNLPDGRVEVLCEGTEEALRLFLEKVAAGPMKRYITQTESSWGDSSGAFDDFQVRYF